MVKGVNKMKVMEIFNSIDGEVNKWGQGIFSTFVRFAGCNLSCPTCDTKQTIPIDSGNEMSLEEVYKEIDKYGCKKVTVTGGEPLFQKNSVLTLLDKLLTKKYKVSIETNGTIAVPTDFFWYDVSWVVDYKLDYADKMDNMAFCNLSEKDYVKILVRGEHDVIKAEEVRKNLLSFGCKANFCLSPVDSDWQIAQIITRFIQDKGWFDWSINMQIHKLIGVK